MKCPQCDSPNDELNRSCSQCGDIFDLTDPVQCSPPAVGNLNNFMLSPGDNFGSRYQIIEQIGSGGMSKVFKALDKELNIQVVLKIIDPELSNTPDAVERFKRELLLAREIVHENVIRIHDLGAKDGIRYISMNYVEGQNLQELIGMAGPLSTGKVLDIISTICQALVIAHGKGIIHRDLKPQNVMIGSKGKVTVLDFGIARSLDQVGTTRTGFIIGTPECMAPEQIQGEKVDASTDIYSLGVMMYQMVTGRVPFKADNMQALLFKHLNESPIPPSAIVPTVPPALERIILKCMKKKPGKRYTSAEKLLKAVGRLLKKKDRRENLRRKLLLLRRPLRFRPLVYLVRFLELAMLLFACASVLGWVVDSHYRGKLLELTAEHPLYFKTRFPMDKDYLPPDWPVRQGDAWKKYRHAAAIQAALPPGETGLLERRIENLHHAVIPPAGIEVVSGVLTDAGNRMGLDNVLAGIASDTLVPQAGEILPTEFIAFFSRWQTLRARLEFLKGNNEGGMQRLCALGIFLTDCEAAAGSLADHAHTLAQFPIFCQETMLLALASDIEPDRKQLERIEPLLLLLLKKTHDGRFFQLAYLDDLQAVRREDFSESWWWGPEYFWFGKFRFMAMLETRDLVLWRTLVAESRARETLSAKPPRREIRTLLDRFRRHDNRKWPQVGSERFYRGHDSLRVNRTLVKLALLLERLQRFGINSKEVVSLLASDLGVNELTGEPWQIVQTIDRTVIRISERVEFTFRPVSYAADHATATAELERLATAIGATGSRP